MRFITIPRQAAALVAEGDGVERRTERWKDVSSADTMMSERVCSYERASSGSLYLLACRIDSRQSTTSRAVGRARSLCNFCSRSGMTIWRASCAAGGMWSSSSVMSLVNNCAIEGKWARCASRESTSGQALRYSSSVPNRLRTSTCMLLIMQLTQFSSSSSPCRQSNTLFNHLYRSLSEREPSDQASSVSISSAISPSSEDGGFGSRKSAKAS